MSGLDNAEESSSSPPTVSHSALTAGGGAMAPRPHPLSAGFKSATGAAASLGNTGGSVGANGVGSSALAQGGQMGNPNAGGFTIRKLNRPTLPNAPYTAPPPPPSSLTPPTPSAPAPSNSAAAAAPLFPALHLTPLNDSFVPKQISLSPPGTRVKIGRQTNAKTVPNGTNGYFDSKVLSRMHAEVWSEDSRVFIKDVKSSNGTFINGRRLSEEAQESEAFELHTDDQVEFGIDIISDDNKTIVHHKVSAKVYLVLNAEDVGASAREFSAWYRNAGEAKELRRQTKPAVNNGSLSFEHVLLRLQGELQKSRDTGTHLGDLGSTLNEVQDTLGGGGSTSNGASSGHLPYTNLQSHVPPYLANGPSAAKDAASGIASLQSQLNATQNALASHVGKIRDLEGLLKEHDLMKREVGELRREMEGAKKDMELVLDLRGNARGRDVGKEIDGRESPVAKMLEEQEADEDEEDDEDDGRSIRSVDTIRSGTRTRTREAGRNGTLPDNADDSNLVLLPSSITSSTPSDPTLHLHLQEQNDRLSSRLEQISTELEEATRLGQSLLSQHAEAVSTIRTLEERVHGLEKAVEEGKVGVQVEKEREERWNGWKNAFEESWKKERKEWEEERKILLEIVRNWEGERARKEQLENEEEDRLEEDDDEDDEEVAVDAGAAKASGNATSARSSLRKPRTRRRRRSSTAKATNGGTMSSSCSPTSLLSGPVDSTVKSIVVPSIQALSSETNAALVKKEEKEAVARKGGFDPSTPELGANMVPYVSAGAIVVVGIVAAWAIALKLKE